MRNIELTKCKKDAPNDCTDCRQNYSSHSLHYDKVHDQKVTEVKCNIEGILTFNEDKELIERF